LSLSVSSIESRRIIDEQKALIRLRSKHVVQLFDIVEIPSAHGTKNGIALILEHIDGEDLRINGFSVSETYLHTIWQISCGLADIHAANIIHRDIKPNNIRINDEGVLKIIDFGLSRSIENAATLGAVGTPIFMAPELWAHEKVEFTSAVDVYAFGITCLMLLSDNAPKAIGMRPPANPKWGDFSGYFSGAPLDIVKGIYQCLDPDPSSRPKIAEIRDLLSRYLRKDKHRATVVMGTQINVLDSNNRKISLSANICKLVITYDGLDFQILEASGPVFVNNTPAVVGNNIPGCCVLTFGNQGNRVFVTFDISNPEVVV
jgi:serine/threonine protein kinase